MDEPLGHIVNIEEGDEDALDAALEMELAATYAKFPVSQMAEPAKLVGDKNSVISEEPTTSQLSFAFPGWESDIFKGGKRKMPSTFGYIDDPLSLPSKRGKQFKNIDAAGPSRALSALEDPITLPVEGCPMDSMDDELLACVFKKLNMKDLCSSMRTCKRWHRVACKEDVWGHLPLPANVPGALPRWMNIRNAAMLMDLRFRFQVFRRGYDFIRSALIAWWDRGKPDGEYPSAVFRSLTQKLVINDWSLLYEAFGAAFSDHADHVGVTILEAVQRIAHLRGSKHGDLITNATESVEGDLPEVFPKLSLKYDADSKASGSREEFLWNEAEVQEIWTLLLTLWRRYKTWLMLVVSHCPELNHEVMAERARSNAMITTPTVYGKGIICFRSQVILKYGIRSVLQATWLGLAGAKRSGLASDIQLDLFRSADHLFQETSIPDDLTLSPRTFTQQKLQRCFGNETSSKTKSRSKTNPALSSAEADGVRFARMAMIIRKS